MNFAKHISKSNKRKLSNQQKGQARNYKTKCNCFCRKRQCQTNTNCLANNYKTVWRVKDKSFCRFCNKPTCEKLAHRQNSSCTVFACLTPHNQNFYCEKQQVKDKSFCSFCNKRRAKKLPTCETCIAQSFACVNTTYANTTCSKLLLRKTAGKRQKFLQILQQTDVRKTCPPTKLVLYGFCLFNTT